MTPVQSYRFGPATKLVVHSSRLQITASTRSRNRNLKKRKGFTNANPEFPKIGFYSVSLHFGCYLLFHEIRLHLLRQRDGGFCGASAAA